MSFDASKYESQIRAILQAPGVDLSTISAKRVRKQLLEQNDDLTPEIVKERKEELDALIGTVYEQVSADVGEDADGGVSAAEENGKRKRQSGGVADGPSSPSSSKKAKKAQKGGARTDEEIARQLAQELNGRDRPTRAAASKPAKPKRSRKNAKSATTVDSDVEGGDGEKKKKGGFTKEYTLSEPLAGLLGAEKMSRPQVVKGIWDYIKARDLQNPTDRREIICDDNLKGIFGMDKIGMFKMNKQLGEHLYEATAA